MDEVISEHVRDAIAELSIDTPSAMGINAIPALCGLVAAGAEIEIDFLASKKIGVPVVIAREKISAPEAYECLTRRQRDVADLLTRGLSNKEIARHLGISVATTKDHVHAVLARLGLKSRAMVAASLRMAKD